MSQSDKPQRKQSGDVVDGEIIAEYNDETLMNLPGVEKDEDRASSTTLPRPEPVESGRRQFITRLVIGGAAALALGGSAALLFRQRETGVVVLPEGAQVGPDGEVDPAILLEEVARLQSEVAGLSAERDQLRLQVADLQALNALWQELDDTGLDGLLVTALEIMSVAVTALGSVVNPLRDGVEFVRGALEDFIESLPSPQAGIRWLVDQVTALSQGLSVIGEQVEQAVEPVEPYSQLIADFIEWVLRWIALPVLNRASAGLEAMRDMIGGLPTTVDGISSRVLVPLADWFGDDRSRSLHGLILDPVADRLLGRADLVIDEFADFQSAYQNELESPVQTALTRREEIRTQIQQMQARIAAGPVGG